MLAQPSSNKLFGHVVVEQQGDAFGEAAATFPGAYKGDGFVFLLATVVRVSQGFSKQSSRQGEQEVWSGDTCDDTDAVVTATPYSSRGMFTCLQQYRLSHHYADVVQVVEVKKTFVGALVRIQAEGRAEVGLLSQTPAISCWHITDTSCWQCPPAPHFMLVGARVLVG